ncbi:hypothetical protein DLE01_40060, partial [Streptomyces sp. FT05W]
MLRRGRGAGCGGGRRSGGGEVLAVQCTGAYTHSMFNQHNRFDKPPVVFVRDGRSRLVVR